MSFLDAVLGSLSGPAAQSPVQGLLMSMLSGQGMAGGAPGTAGQPAAGGFSLASIASQFLGGGGKDPAMATATTTDTGINPQAAIAAGLAGLPAILAMLHNSGLGAIAQSWISSGANQPIAPEQVAQAFGPDHVQAMARQTGMDTQSLLAALAHALPQVIDQLTPHGQLPQAPASA